MNRDYQADFIPDILDGKVEPSQPKEADMKPRFINTLKMGLISLNHVHRFYVEKVNDPTDNFTGWAVVARMHDDDFTIMVLHTEKEAWVAIEEYVEVVGEDLNN